MGSALPAGAAQAGAVPGVLPAAFEGPAEGGLQQAFSEQSLSFVELPPFPSSSTGGGPFGGDQGFTIEAFVAPQYDSVENSLLSSDPVAMPRIFEAGGAAAADAAGVTASGAAFITLALAPAYGALANDSGTFVGEWLALNFQARVAQARCFSAVPPG